MIADFLNYLFRSKKLSPRTIEGYKTAIADFLRFHTEENLNENIFLNKLIKSFKSEALSPKTVFPRWDLATILNFLNQLLSELLSDAELSSS